MFSTLLGVSAFCGAFLDILRAFVFKKTAPLAGTLGYLVLILTGVLFAMGAGFILSIAGGNLK